MASRDIIQGTSGEEAAVPFAQYDSSTGMPVTGYLASFVVGDIKLRLPGGAFADITPDPTPGTGNLVEWGFGVYAVLLTNIQTNVPGAGGLRVSISGHEEYKEFFNIVRSAWHMFPGGFAAGTYGELCARPTGTVTADAGNNSSAFRTSLTGIPDNYYKDTWCTFLDGALINQTHKVITSNGTTGLLAFNVPYTATPAGATRFMLVNK